MKLSEQLKEIKAQFETQASAPNKWPASVLLELFCAAVDEIDKLQNIVMPSYEDYSNEIDERDFKDIICDKGFIIEDLFTQAIETNEIAEDMGVD